MREETMFIQECPVCGRPAQIGTQYRGQAVTCGHCGGSFVADPDDDPQTKEIRSRWHGRFVEHLLELAASRQRAIEAILAAEMSGGS